MLRARPMTGRLLSLLLAGGAAAALPREAAATIGGGLGLSGFSMFVYNVCTPLGGTFFNCSQAGVRVDPVGTVQHVAMTLDYDFSGPNFTFNAALSGPLCSFSIGGSCPPATPGVGTQPLPIFSAFPDFAGAPLPGSVLTMVDDGLAVTLDYVLASPLAVLTEENFFVFAFDYITPVTIDAALSTVSYSPAVVPGSDFVILSSLCESDLVGGPPCGSLLPAVSITLNLVTPEPTTTGLVAVGAGALLLTAARRRKGAPRPS